MLSFEATSLAQPSAEDKAIAEALFIDGRKLMEKEQFNEACPKLEESYRLDPAAGTQINMAVCHEKQGKIATAWGEFKQAAAAARKDGNKAREDLAREHIAAVEPKLPKLAVEVPAAVAKIPGLKVTRNGTQLGAGSWGTELPVDPGPQVIEVTAPDYKPWKTTTDVKIEGHGKVVVAMLEAAPKPITPPVSSAAPTAPLASAAPTAPPPPAEFWTTKRTTGAILGGVGIIGIGVGSVFGVTALSKRSDSDKQCPANQCTVDGVKLNDDAKKAARVADFGIGIGLVAGAAGTFLFVTGGDSKPSSSGAATRPNTARLQRVDVGPIPGGAGAMIQGAW